MSFPCRHHEQQGADRWPQKLSQECHRDGVAALPTPVCCVMSSDPTITMESERSFLRFVLTDQQLRGHLLSEMGMQLGAQGNLLLAAACTDSASTYSRFAGRIDISHDQYLSGNLKRLREARPLPRSEKRCLPRVGAESASQVRTSTNYTRYTLCGAERNATSSTTWARERGGCTLE